MEISPEAATAACRAPARHDPYALRDHRVIEGTNAGVWETNLRTGAVWFSPRFKALLGYGDEEVSGGFGWVYAHVHPSDLRAYRSSQRA